MRRNVLVIACFASACAASTPAPSAPCPAPAPAQAAPVDSGVAPDRIAFWRGVREHDFAVPAGSTAEVLAPELVSFLGSPDPVVRDEIAYEVLAAWIVDKKLLAPPALRTLTTALLANVAAPIDAAPDAVFRRSFSALALSLIAARELATPFLTADELHAQVRAAAAYAAAETDLRGHVGAQGWAHAAAHTSDWLGRLARHPSLTREDAIAILGAVADLAVRRHGHNFHHGEDSRLAAPVMSLLRADRLDRDAFAPWVDRLLSPFQEQGPFEPARYAAQRNGRNLLYTLFVFLTVEDKRTPTIDMALAVVRAAAAS